MSVIFIKKLGIKEIWKWARKIIIIALSCRQQLSAVIICISHSNELIILCDMESHCQNCGVVAGAGAGAGVEEKTGSECC